MPTQVSAGGGVAWFGHIVEVNFVVAFWWSASSNLDRDRFAQTRRIEGLSLALLGDK